MAKSHIHIDYWGRISHEDDGDLSISGADHRLVLKRGDQLDMVEMILERHPGMIDEIQVLSSTQGELKELKAEVMARFERGQRRRERV